MSLGGAGAFQIYSPLGEKSLGFCHFYLSVSWKPWYEQLPSTTCFCHDIFPWHKAPKQSDLVTGLKPLKQWTKKKKKLAVLEIVAIFCICPTSVRITGIHHHTWLNIYFFEIDWNVFHSNRKLIQWRYWNIFNWSRFYHLLRRLPCLPYENT